MTEFNSDPVTELTAEVASLDRSAKFARREGLETEAARLAESAQLQAQADHAERATQQPAPAGDDVG